MSHPLLNIAVAAARKAGSIIARAVDRPEAVRIFPKADHDFVTDIDQTAEKAIIETIHKVYPSHSILAEESGHFKGDDTTWIIDPLDGTANFIHGFPHIAVSIAVQYKDTLEHGVIYDPLRQELFTASRGQGAKLNRYRMRVSQRLDLKGALIGTGFPHKNIVGLETYLKDFSTFTRRGASLRRAGSAALDLAYVAAGRLDGFWEYGLRPWDVAAGILCITEAGGLVCEPDNGKNYLDSGNLMAANPKLMPEMLEITANPSF